jgi:hypothetical protein
LFGFQIFKYSNIQIFKFSNIQIFKYSNGYDDDDDGQIQGGLNPCMIPSDHDAAGNNDDDDDDDKTTGYV